MTRAGPIALVTLVTLGPGAVAGLAQTPAGTVPRVDVVFDVRGRFEADVDSTRDDGTEIDDRVRLRGRARADLTAWLGPRWLVGWRVRTGPVSSQQSSHLTFADLTDGPRDNFSGSVDKLFAGYSSGRVEAWGGRNEFPFWTPHEMFWDRDATILGGFALVRGPGKTPLFDVRGGYFAVPDGAIGLAGRLAAGQVVLSRPVSPSWSVRAAAGFFALEGVGETRYLITGNGQRDYRVGLVSGQLSRPFETGPVGSVRLGGDLMQNFRDYGDADSDPIASNNRDERSGFALMAALGGRARTGSRGAWEASYTYARIRKLALNASYAQDDWVRWGSGGQVDSSDLKGHELNGRVWLGHGFDVQARAFFVDSITTPQDGTRVRLDTNWRFAIGW